MRENFLEYGGPLWTVAITPPGADRLPWACTRNHKHSGPDGCRVEEFAGDVWAANARRQWRLLRDAARRRTIRATGFAPTIIERVWEPQKRGVPHLHVVLGMGSEVEKIAAKRFGEELAALSHEYDFGNVDLPRKTQGAKEAARYLVGYLLGRSSHKSTIRENIADPRMPRQLVWLTPKLTRRTFVTMRRLRYVRWYLAALAGKASILPRGRVFRIERVRLARAVTRIAPHRGPPDDELRFRFHLRNLELLAAA